MNFTKKIYFISLVLFVGGLNFFCTPKMNFTQNSNTIEITSSAPVVPLFKNESKSVLIRLRVFVPKATSSLKISSAELNANDDALKNIDSLIFYYTGIEPTFNDKRLIGSSILNIKESSINTDISLDPGLHYLWLAAVVNKNASLNDRPEVHISTLKDSEGKTVMVKEEGDGFSKRIGFTLRKRGEDKVNTYRIPGIATTDKGTLIAVYDIRYNNARDLPENIDVGMSRSTDGGQTWEPMKNIMDMGAPHANNGIGDPAILFDPVTKKIWVAALWSKGNRSIGGSIGGISPDSTGQFMLASSDDDGHTWSQVINITPQVKNPSWKIFFQGPGSGIAMQNGTLVFPAQYWDAMNMPYSTLIYSKDHGKNWVGGIGAKSNTTESAIVETTDGTLLLNMRDNRGKFRSTSTTTDMGKTWTETANSYSALPDPVCMGSLIKANVKVNNGMNDFLFFSNENSQHARINTTIKASADNGNSWPLNHQLLVDERGTYGYSSLTRIDENTLGLLYEGAGEMYFVRISVSDIVKN